MSMNAPQSPQPQSPQNPPSQSRQPVPPQPQYQQPQQPSNQQYPPQPPRYPQPQYPQYAPYPYPQPYVDPVRVHRRALRTAVGRPAGLILAYQAVFTAVSMVVGFTIGLAMLVYGMESDTNADLMRVQEQATQAGLRWTGVISLTSVGFGFLFMLLMRRRSICTREFWAGDRQRGRMRPAWLLVFIVLIISAQAVFTLLQMALQAMGLSLVSPTSEAIDQSAVTVSMWLYIGLVGPIVEEVVFRGVLMKELKPMGRNFAILTSSLMFALYHDDLVQGAFAFAIGLLLGFVAMEYSVLWSIALHIFNNAVIGGASSLIAMRFGTTGEAVFSLALLAIGVIGLIVIMAKHGWGLRLYHRVNRSAPGAYWGWTSGRFITFCVLNALVALVSFAVVALM
ncbi:MAG: CPBP family intramembrane glutamic endopeptidase [Bifidobacterium scardovii]|uniref:CPBP family intramembrane glutamic endopeptidase n=2 Tax=Bifidobacterium scardovii TaxID=158787 RepID=UPI00128D2E4C|nr:CPBP family intramembrane glutamic endopeptidase [Bifidobacterium scardovii]MBS6947458.1 CPBP family intramembrane metalloprotease [Bifidobacterium scardovii]MDU3736773.1 CPBP family intramembrane glutamic endopeptidase [Bifidobacterium scardovii]MDU5296180.1 CPBP family intramembrane glutamic endopeptidase [Bifidobacterium scardovii]MDU5610780.1 CPBP family intramembrane glutamic endopeptidase [Bifidobacterium scardovii]MDU5886004.1 CPBP family intramembrane glutamic endopeptidase [Bifidob